MAGSLPPAREAVPSHCMDVTCNRCGTVYEFEEGLISTTGTTVKCTQCGHLFKVHRTASPPPPEEPEPESALRWRVKRVDGSTHSLESLAELTRLIGAGQFQRDDQISRTGQVWRKLGEIAELSSLFEPLRRVRRMSQPPPVPLLVAEPASSQTTPVEATGEVPPERPRRRTASNPRFQSQVDEVDLAARTQPRPPLDAAGMSTPVSPPPPVPAAAADNARAPEPSAPAQLLAREPAPELPQGPDLRRAPGPLLWFLLGVPLALAAAVGGAMLLRAPHPAPHVEPARVFSLRGDQLLAAHRLDRFDQAIGEYDKALALAKDDPHILSSISRVYAVWSQWLRFRLDAAVAEGGRPGAKLGALRAQVRDLVAQAKLYGERAAQRNPGNEEASVALADAQRLNGNLVGARAELDRARATEGVPAAETLRVAALLARDEAQGDWRAARPLAEQAVAQDPSMIRARALLLRCLLADGDIVGARMHLDAVRRIDPEHPLLAELGAEIERAERAAKTPPPAAAIAAPAPRPAQGAAGHAAPQASQPPAAPSAPQLSPIELVRRGEASLERGAVQTAEHSFEQALELSPHMPRAETGLGYVALERSEPERAISHFRPAARDGHPEAFIGLGDAYRRLGRSKDALDAYQTYLRRFPKGVRSSIAQRQSELLTEQLSR